MKTHWIIVILVALALTGCSSAAPVPEPLQEQMFIPVVGMQVSDADESSRVIADAPKPRYTPTAEAATANPANPLQPTLKVDVLEEKYPTATPTLTPYPTIEHFDPVLWKNWPVMPVVSEEMRALYQAGLAQGNNPYAFSVLGDCQSQPEVFMGVYDSDPTQVDQLPFYLQETVANFAGSFDRYSPTVKDGTTEGALLWIQWNDNLEKKCEVGETPLDCELRVNKPSIVFVHVGTHWEKRSQLYFNRIIDRILEHKAVPILVTKADNREQDERINHNYALMASERSLPLWNFWVTVQHLPGGGMITGSTMYLTDEAMVIHRDGALQALDTVWRAVR